MPRRLLLAEEPFLHGAMPLLISSRLGSSFGTSGEAAQAQVALRLKIMQVLSRSSFNPVHCIGVVLQSIKLRCRVRHKKLQPTPQYRDEGCYASVVPPGLQRRKNIIQQHCRFVSALTPQVRSALRRKLRGGSAVLPRESLAPNGFLSEGRKDGIGPFIAIFLFTGLLYAFCAACQLIFPQLKGQ